MEYWVTAQHQKLRGLWRCWIQGLLDMVELQQSFQTMETRSTQWFPNKADRQLIEWGMWLPVQMTFYDAKTGNNQQVANLESIKDNLDLMINGSHFGSFNGTLYERIMAAWNDKKLNSYNLPGAGNTDNANAWYYWNSRNGWNGLGPYDPLQDLASQFSAFGLHYKPLINETSPINKLGFAYGLAVLDLAKKMDRKETTLPFRRFTHQRWVGRCLKTSYQELIRLSQVSIIRQLQFQFLNIWLPNCRQTRFMA